MAKKKLLSFEELEKPSVLVGHGPWEIPKGGWLNINNTSKRNFVTSSHTIFVGST